MDEKVNGIETSILIHRAEELQRERDEKQNALEALAHRVEELQWEVDAKTESVEALSHRVEELQRERDELRKDIEQLCMQQAGPSYISVATRMLSQRAAGLEQEIQNLQKKLGGCLRENKNLQEELAEAYRVKSQLADLHGAELSKNKDLEKQVKFFQSSVAQAFAERDHSLMECEKAKEREEAISKQSIDFDERIKECQSAYVDQKRLNDALQMELREVKTQIESYMKVVTKFYEVRARDTGCPPDITLEEKCSILLHDCPECWIFSTDGKTSTSKYIASLEEEKQSLKSSVAKLQNNLRMGLEIEQHLQRTVRSLEKKKKLYDDLIRNGISALHKFYSHQRMEIMKILEDEESHLRAVVSEVQDKLNQIHVNSEIEAPQGEQHCCDSRCKDRYFNADVNSNKIAKVDLPAVINSGTFDDSKALAQAMQEKVKDEKVKALMELAELKQEYLVFKEYAAGPPKSISGHDREGMLKTFLKRTSLKRWVRKESSHNEHEKFDENSSVNNEYSVDLARLKVEHATLLESIANMERLILSIHRLHIILMKAQDDVKSDGPLESIYEALDSVITEANLMKTALGVVLPVSWSGDSSDAITHGLFDPADLPKLSKTDKVDPMSSAGLEMLELLIFAAQILKESSMGKNMD